MEEIWLGALFWWNGAGTNNGTHAAFGDVAVIRYISPGPRVINTIIQALVRKGLKRSAKRVLTPSDDVLWSVHLRSWDGSTCDHSERCNDESDWENVNGRPTQSISFVFWKIDRKRLLDWVPALHSLEIYRPLSDISVVQQSQTAEHSPVIKKGQRRNSVYECTKIPNQGCAVHEKLERNSRIFDPIFLDKVPSNESYRTNYERGQNVCRWPCVLLATPDKTDSK